MQLDKKQIIYGIIVLIMLATMFLISGCSQTTPYEIVGDSVIVNDSVLFMNVTPHTISNSQWVELEFESKIFTGDIDLAFGFDTDDVYPVASQRYHVHDVVENYTCQHDFIYTTNPNYFWCYYTVEGENITEPYNVTVFEHEFLTVNLEQQITYWNETINWTNLNLTESVEYDFVDMNKWYYAQNQSIEKNKKYKIRYYLNIPYNYNSESGKYTLAIKPSDESLEDAIQNEHFWLLDPWYDYDLDDGLLLYYSFDGGVDCGDLTGNERNCTTNGNPIKTPALLNDSYLYVATSSQYLDTTPENLALSEMTVCAWFNSSGSSDTQDIYSRGSDDANGRCQVGFSQDGCFRLQTGSGSGSVTIRFGIDTNSDTFVDVTDTDTYNDAEFHQICGVYNGSGIQLYADGSLKSGTATSGALDSNYAMYIGRTAFSGDPHYFNGDIDEMGVWNRSLTASEITGLYNGGLGLEYGSEGVSISSATITPTNAYADSNLNCSAYLTNAWGDDMDVNLTWKQNAVAQPTYNKQYTSLPNGSWVYNDLVNGIDLGVNTQWDCNISVIITGDPTNSSSTVVTKNISSISIDNCTSNGDIIFNASLLNEETLDFVNLSAKSTNMKIELTLSSFTSGIVVSNYSYGWDDFNNFTVCIENGTLNDTSFKYDIQAEFSADDYVTEFWFLDNGNLSNASNLNSYTTKTVNFMDLLASDSTTFLMRYLDEDGLKVDDIIIIAYRKYVDEGIFREVERGKQNDEGETVLHLVEEDAIYYFTVTQNGSIIFTSNQFQATCPAVPCTIDLEASADFIPFSTDWDLVSDGAYSRSMNSSKREFYLTFQASNSSQWNYTIYKYSNNPEEATRVNSSSLTSTGGTITVYVPASAGNITYVGRVHRDNSFLSDSFVAFDNKQITTFARAGGPILAGIVILSMIMMAISQGVGVIAFAVLGLVFVGIIKMIELNWTAFILFIAMGIMLIFKLTRRTD